MKCFASLVDWVCSTHWIIDLALSITLMHGYAPMLSSSDMWGMWSARGIGRGENSYISVGIGYKTGPGAPG